MMNREWFINEYAEIHENLSQLESEIKRHQGDKLEIFSDSLILEGLKDRVKKEIERLNNTRRHEREIFNY